MIVCTCTGTTDHAYARGQGHRLAGKLCRGCAPTLAEIDRQLPDCLTCPGKAAAAPCQLFGFDICEGCYYRWKLHQVRLEIREQPPEELLRWALLVHETMNRENLRTVRAATRAAHARLAGLEVDAWELEGA